MPKLEHLFYAVGLQLDEYICLTLIIMLHVCDRDSSPLSIKIKGASYIDNKKGLHSLYATGTTGSFMYVNNKNPYKITCFCRQNLFLYNLRLYLKELQTV